MRLLVAGMALLLVPAAVAGQQSVRLTVPDASFPEPFSGLRGLRELPGGRVVVSDGLERLVALLDFETGEVTPIGREGQGPGEYGSPGPLFAWPGDSTLLLDFGNMRGLVLHGTAVGRTIRLQAADDLPLVPRAVDGAGHLYGMLPRMSPTVPSGADSTPIVRLDPATGRIDTAAWIGGERAAGGVIIMRRGSGGGVQLQTTPYGPEDGWTVASDGSVAVVDAETYQVTWTGPDGRRRAGPVLPYEPVPIGKAEKAEWVEEQANMRFTVRTPQGSQSLRGSRPDPDDYDWPAHKPPFPARGVFMAPSGHVWIRVSQPAGANTEQFDIIDRNGARIRRVELPPGRRLAGLGAGSVYATRTDADDLLWLERYRLD